LSFWKHALGQLCAYKLHLTRRKTILYLYGPVEHPREVEKARLTCNQYGIVVDYKRCSIPVFRLSWRIRVIGSTHHSHNSPQESASNIAGPKISI
jgi:hypothetical protein